jgi:CHASE2 domain-containing sensor protein
MKWYNYVACFLAGVFLIHILPHALNGFSLKNVIGILVSLVGGCLLLWVGRFSPRNPIAIALVFLGMASVLIFTWLHPHKPHHPATSQSIDSPMQ